MRARPPHPPSDQPEVTSSFDWLYALWVALVIASVWAFIGAPLVVALASRLTRLRRSRGKQTSLWVIAVVATIFTTLPLLIAWLGWSTTHVEEHRFVVG